MAPRTSAVRFRSGKRGRLGISVDRADANFNAPGSKHFNRNAFYGRADTGMQIKVFALDAATGRSMWRFADGSDFVLLKVGAALRHLSVANKLLYVTTSSGELFVLDTVSGRQRFHDQTRDLNQELALGLTSPHHAGMNAGAVIADGMVFVPYGGQNEPSGMIAYHVGR